MVTKMKLAYITSMKSGLSAFNYKEIVELLKRGVDVTIFPTKYGEGPYMAPSGSEIYRYSRSKVLAKQGLYKVSHPIKYMKLLKEAMSTRTMVDMMLAWEFASKAKDMDHIHAHHGDHKFFIGYYMKKILGIPLTVTIHSHSLWINPNVKMFKKALELADGIVSISDYNKKVLIEKYGVEPKKIKVIRLFADPDMLNKKPTKKILIVGQFAERKGHETLFKAIKASKRDDVTIWVVGGGTWDTEGYVDVEGLIKKYGLDDRVVLFGKVSDSVLNELYQVCDIFCLPSLTDSQGNKEGIPVTLMEAMAYGKPVVSTRHAGIPELVPDEWLVKEGDWKGLSKLLAELLDGKYDIAQIAEKHRRVIMEKYSVDNVDELLGYMRGKSGSK